MERNANENLGGQNFGQGSTTGGTTGGYGAAGAGGAGTFGESGTGGETGGRSAIDRAGTEGQGRAQQLKDRAGQAATTVREKAGELKTTLADKLEAGAEKLRNRGQAQTQTGGYAGATGEGSVAVGQNRLGGLTDSLAGGMQNTADWLRDTDLDSLRTDVEQQVKDHPGRTLLIALGVGYLIGKAFRK
jgi:hypothetical protein